MGDALFDGGATNLIAANELRILQLSANLFFDTFDSVFGPKAVRKCRLLQPPAGRGRSLRVPGGRQVKCAAGGGGDGGRIGGLIGACGIYVARNIVIRSDTSRYGNSYVR